MTITALPASDRTGCAGTGWHKQLLPAHGFVLQVKGRWHHPCLGWKQLCPAALSRLDHVGFAVCSPDVWLWLAALVCSSSLKTGRKWKQDIQCTGRANPDVMRVLITHVHPSMEKEMGETEPDGAETGEQRRLSAQGT